MFYVFKPFKLLAQLEITENNQITFNNQNLLKVDNSISVQIIDSNTIEFTHSNWVRRLKLHQKPHELFLNTDGVWSLGVQNQDKSESYLKIFEIEDLELISMEGEIVKTKFNNIQKPIQINVTDNCEISFNNSVFTFGSGGRFLFFELFESYLINNNTTIDTENGEIIVNVNKYKNIETEELFIGVFKNSVLHLYNNTFLDIRLHDLDQMINFIVLGSTEAQIGSWKENLKSNFDIYCHNTIELYKDNKNIIIVNTDDLQKIDLEIKDNLLHYIISNTDVELQHQDRIFLDIPKNFNLDRSILNKKVIIQRGQDYIVDNITLKNFANHKHTISITKPGDTLVVDNIPVESFGVISKPTLYNFHNPSVVVLNDNLVLMTQENQKNKFKYQNFIITTDISNDVKLLVDENNSLYVQNIDGSVFKCNENLVIEKEKTLFIFGGNQMNLNSNFVSTIINENTSQVVVHSSQTPGGLFLNYQADDNINYNLDFSLIVENKGITETFILNNNFELIFFDFYYIKPNLIKAFDDLINVNIQETKCISLHENNLLLWSHGNNINEYVTFWKFLSNNNVYENIAFKGSSNEIAWNSETYSNVSDLIFFPEGVNKIQSGVTLQDTPAYFCQYSDNIFNVYYDSSDLYNSRILSIVGLPIYNNININPTTQSISYKTTTYDFYNTGQHIYLCPPEQTTFKNITFENNSFNQVNIENGGYEFNGQFKIYFQDIYSHDLILSTDGLSVMDNNVLAQKFTSSNEIIFFPGSHSTILHENSIITLQNNDDHDVLKDLTKNKTYFLLGFNGVYNNIVLGEHSTFMGVDLDDYNVLCNKGSHVDNTILKYVSYENFLAKTNFSQGTHTATVKIEDEIIKSYSHELSTLNFTKNNEDVLSFFSSSENSKLKNSGVLIQNNAFNFYDLDGVHFYINGSIALSSDDNYYKVFRDTTDPILLRKKDGFYNDKTIVVNNQDLILQENNNNLINCLLKAGSVFFPPGSYEFIGNQITTDTPVCVLKYDNNGVFLDEFFTEGESFPGEIINFFDVNTTFTIDYNSGVLSVDNYLLNNSMAIGGQISSEISLYRYSNGPFITSEIDLFTLTPSTNSQDMLVAMGGSVVNCPEAYDHPITLHVQDGSIVRDGEILNGSFVIKSVEPGITSLFGVQNIDVKFSGKVKLYNSNLEYSFNNGYKDLSYVIHDWEGNSHYDNIELNSIFDIEILNFYDLNESVITNADGFHFMENTTNSKRNYNLNDHVSLSLEVNDKIFVQETENSFVLFNTQYPKGIVFDKNQGIHIVVENNNIVLGSYKYSFLDINGQSFFPKNNTTFANITILRDDGIFLKRDNNDLVLLDNSTTIKDFFITNSNLKITNTSIIFVFNDDSNSLVEDEKIIDTKNLIFEKGAMSFDTEGQIEFINYPSSSWVGHTVNNGSLYMILPGESLPIVLWDFENQDYSSTSLNFSTKDLLIQNHSINNVNSQSSTVLGGIIYIPFGLLPQTNIVFKNVTLNFPDTTVIMYDYFEEKAFVKIDSLLGDLIHLPLLKYPIVIEDNLYTGFNSQHFKSIGHKTATTTNTTTGFVEDFIIDGMPTSFDLVNNSTKVIYPGDQQTLSEVGSFQNTTIKNQENYHLFYEISNDGLRINNSLFEDSFSSELHFEQNSLLVEGITIENWTKGLIIFKNMINNAGFFINNYKVDSEQTIVGYSKNSDDSINFSINGSKEILYHKGSTSEGIQIGELAGSIENIKFNEDNFVFSDENKNPIAFETLFNDNLKILSENAFNNSINVIESDGYVFLNQGNVLISKIGDAKFVHKDHGILTTDDYNRTFYNDVHMLSNTKNIFLSPGSSYEFNSVTIQCNDDNKGVILLINSTDALHLSGSEVINKNVLDYCGSNNISILVNYNEVTFMDSEGKSILSTPRGYDITLFENLSVNMIDSKIISQRKQGQDLCVSKENEFTNLILKKYFTNTDSSAVNGFYGTGINLTKCNKLQLNFDNLLSGHDLNIDLVNNTYNALFFGDQLNDFNFNSEGFIDNLIIIPDNSTGISFDNITINTSVFFFVKNLTYENNKRVYVFCNNYHQFYQMNSNESQAITYDITNTAVSVQSSSFSFLPVGIFGINNIFGNIFLDQNNKCFNFKSSAPFLFQVINDSSWISPKPAIKIQEFNASSPKEYFMTLDDMESLNTLGDINITPEKDSALFSTPSEPQSFIDNEDQWILKNLMHTKDVDNNLIIPGESLSVSSGLQVTNNTTDSYYYTKPFTLNTINGNLINSIFIPENISSIVFQDSGITVDNNSFSFSQDSRENICVTEADSSFSMNLLGIDHSFNITNNWGLLSRESFILSLLEDEETTEINFANFMVKINETKYLNSLNLNEITLGDDKKIQITMNDNLTTLNQSILDLVNHRISLFPKYEAIIFEKSKLNESKLKKEIIKEQEKLTYDKVVLDKSFIFGDASSISDVDLGVNFTPAEENFVNRDANNLYINNITISNDAVNVINNNNYSLWFNNFKTQILDNSDNIILQVTNYKNGSVFLNKDINNNLELVFDNVRIPNNEINFINNNNLFLVVQNNYFYINSENSTNDKTISLKIFGDQLATLQLDVNNKFELVSDLIFIPGPTLELIYSQNYSLVLNTDNFQVLDSSDNTLININISGNDSVTLQKDSNDNFEIVTTNIKISNSALQLISDNNYSLVFNTDNFQILDSSNNTLINVNISGNDSVTLQKDSNDNFEIVTTNIKIPNPELQLIIDNNYSLVINTDNFQILNSSNNSLLFIDQNIISGDSCFGVLDADINSVFGVIYNNIRIRSDELNFFQNNNYSLVFNSGNFQVIYNPSNDTTLNLNISGNSYMNLQLNGDNKPTLTNEKLLIPYDVLYDIGTEYSLVVNTDNFQILDSSNNSLLFIDQNIISGDSCFGVLDADINSVFGVIYNNIRIKSDELNFFQNNNYSLVFNSGNFQVIYNPSNDTTLNLNISGNSYMNLQLNGDNKPTLTNEKLLIPYDVLYDIGTEYSLVVNANGFQILNPNNYSWRKTLSVNYNVLNNFQHTLENVYNSHISQYCFTIRHMVNNTSDYFFSNRSQYGGHNGSNANEDLKEFLGGGNSTSVAYINFSQISNGIIKDENGTTVFKNISQVYHSPHGILIVHIKNDWPSYYLVPITNEMFDSSCDWYNYGIFDSGDANASSGLISTVNSYYIRKVFSGDAYADNDKVLIYDARNDSTE